MKKLSIFAVIIVILLFMSIILFTGRFFSHRSMHNQPAAVAENDMLQPKEINRIVSLAPSLTEIAFALGLEEKLVGVTRFCNYPREAEKITKVGGFYDPNYEAIINVKPDLVLLLIEHEEIRLNLEKMNIRTLVLDNQHIQGTIESIILVGQVCGSREIAEKLAAAIRAELHTIRERVSHQVKPRCMFIVDRDRQKKGIEDVYVSAAGSFYEEIIDYAGGVNACTITTMEYPKVSAEGILQMNPEIIIEMVGEDVALPSEDILREQWSSIPQLSAVKNNRIYYFTQDYAVVPGPRFIQVVKDCARLFHPDIEW